MPANVENISELITRLGEGPHWDPLTQSLYYVDIFGQSIHRYDLDKQISYKANIGKGSVSLIIPVEGEKDCFVISVGREIVKIHWDGESDHVTHITKLWEVDNGKNTRINDGKCDPTGRLWAGTMGPEPKFGHIEPNKGKLFSFESQTEVKTHLDQVSISNGLAWNPALRKMYYIDSPRCLIDQFDIDFETATLSNRKTIFSLDKHNIPGFPDGMTIDTDGNLWIAIFNGNRVIKIDPRKAEKLMDTILLPATQVTSVAFGGPNLDILYVTTASLPIEGSEFPQPVHGSIYKITGTGATGYPGINIKL